MSEVNFKSKSKAYLAVMEDKAKKLLRKLGREAAEKAKQSAPRDTGDLQSRINYKLTDNRDSYELEVGARNKGHGFLAHIHEFGYMHNRIGLVPPRPFIGPATQDLDDELRKGLAKISRELDDEFGER